MIINTITTCQCGNEKYEVLKGRKRPVFKCTKCKKISMRVVPVIKGDKK